jgi:type I restriction enzyme S subunit
MAGETLAVHTPSTAASLPPDWNWKRLDAVCEGIFDCPHSTPVLAERGPYIARSQDIRSGVFRMEEAGRVSENTYRERIARAEPRRGDLLYSREGTYFGIAAAVPPGVRVCLGQRMVLLRPDPSRADFRFLRYWLNSPVMVLHIHGYRDGTVAERLNLPTIRTLPVALPPLGEQRAIAHILGTLDDKTELNRRMSETLEAMARALFKSWFVEFDPVRAKAEGRDPGLPQPLADLFPDSFEDSELGEIPRGWEVGTLGDVAEHPRRGVQPNSIKPDTPYIALEHMPKRCITLSDWSVGDGLGSNKFAFRKGEILFGKLRPYFHKVGVAPVDGVCSTDIVVVAPRIPHWFAFVLGVVSSDEFVEYTNAGSTGTKMPRTSWAEMARYDIALPPKAVAQAFTERVRPAVDRIIAGIHESRTLAALREALLPKLISGELRVKDAERFLETPSP